MRSLRCWLVRLIGAIRRRPGDGELSAEIESHLEMAIDDNLHAGMAPDEAHRDAFMRLGGIELTMERYRDRRGLHMVETVIQDIRYTVRAMRKVPAFTAVALLTLALGIGATTAIFSVVDTVVLRPLSYRNPKSLFVVHEVIPNLSHLAGAFSPVNALHFREWREASRAFEQMSLVGITSVNLTGAGEPERLQAARVSSNLFTTLGVELKPIPNIVVKTDYQWLTNEAGTGRSQFNVNLGYAF